MTAREEVWAVGRVAAIDRNTPCSEDALAVERLPGGPVRLDLEALLRHGADSTILHIRSISRHTIASPTPYLTNLVFVDPRPRIALARRFTPLRVLRRLSSEEAPHVSPGHPYSPIPSAEDRARARRRADALPDDLTALPGIDLRADAQLALLSQLADDYDSLPFTMDAGDCRFGYDNTWFSYADAVLLALMVRRHRPRRVIEVGCGHSSALLLDARDLWCDDLSLAFIDPDLERLRSITRPGDLDDGFMESVVQDVPVEVFAGLESDDMLLIDSSHVLKAGSDVQYLLDEVLPALRPGVLVHVHDVFYPFEYPASWLDAGVAFTEAYALRLILQSSTAYRIELFTDYLLRRHLGLWTSRMPMGALRPFPTGGLWLRRQPTP